jgi:predicted transcriptional regulator
MNLTYFPMYLLTWGSSPIVDDWFSRLHTMKYRSSTEIIDSILRSIGSGSPKTQIMYRSYLSYSQLKGYLKLLEQRGLIVFDAPMKLYTLTEKGMRFMSAYDTIHELVPGADEREKPIPEAMAPAPEGFNY